MATLVVTKEFIDTLFIEAEKDEYHADLAQFIKQETFGVNLICDFSSIVEYESFLTENPFWEILLDKCDKVKFNDKLNEEVQKDEFYTKLTEQNLFLSSLSQGQCDQLSKKYGFVYVSIENISLDWKPMKYIRSNGSFKVTNDSRFPNELKFDDWSKFDNFCLPLTSIVIFDRYILKDESNQKLSDNLFKLLKKLCPNQLKKPVNLTIISEFKTDDQIIKAYKKIESFFADNLIENISLNILRHDKNQYPPNFEGLHYRLILTNNLRIKCDDSFNFFKTNGRVNNDADLHISFHMCRTNKCFYDKEIGDIKRYVSRLKNIPLEIQLANKIYFYKDKENYLFN